MPYNLTTWDLTALLPIREEGVLRIFIALKNPLPWPGFEPSNFGCSGQHTNHYTTKATSMSLVKNILRQRKSGALTEIRDVLIGHGGLGLRRKIQLLHCVASFL
jgi:hypothetical protein